jgi:hypothetical protein
LVRISSLVPRCTDQSGWLASFYLYNLLTTPDSVRLRKTQCRSDAPKTFELILAQAVSLSFGKARFSPTSDTGEHTGSRLDLNVNELAKESWLDTCFQADTSRCWETAEYLFYVLFTRLPSPPLDYAKSIHAKILSYQPATERHS